MVAMIPVADAEECCTICGEEPGCVSWTLYEGQCYLKDGFTDSKPCSECKMSVQMTQMTRLLKRCSHLEIRINFCVRM